MLVIVWYSVQILADERTNNREKQWNFVDVCVQRVFRMENGSSTLHVHIQPRLKSRAKGAITLGPPNLKLRFSN